MTKYICCLSFLFILLTSCQGEVGKIIANKGAPVVLDKTIVVKNVLSQTLTLKWKGAEARYPPLTYAVYQSKSNNISTLDDVRKNGTEIRGFQKTLEFNVTGLNAATIYYFVVVVKDKNGNKAMYNVVSAQTASAVVKPTLTNPTITTSDITATSIKLSWNAASSRTILPTYAVYQSSRNNISTLSDINTNGTEIRSFQTTLDFNVTGLTAATTYYFVVVVKDKNGNKAVYNVVTAQTTNIPSYSGNRVFTFSNGRVLTIHKSNNVASLKISQADYDKLNTGYNSVSVDKGAGVRPGPGMMSVFNKEIIYNKFEGDAFDFIFYCNVSVSAPSKLRYAGIFANVKNEVRGIGSSVNSILNRRELAAHGATDKLQGVMHLSSRINLIRGPSLHELLHRWGNWVLDSKMKRGGKEVSAQPHWGYTDVGGQLGGFDRTTFKDLGNKLYEGKMDGHPFGVNANGGNGVPYSKLELYLMGLIPKTEVPPIRVFSGLNATGASIPTRYQFYAGKVKTVTIDDIIADKGERIPKPDASQKNFRVLVVYVTPKDLTQAEWSQFSSDVEKFTRSSSDGDSNTYNFWEATGGRATLKADELKSLLK